MASDIEMSKLTILVKEHFLRVLQELEIDASLDEIVDEDKNSEGEKYDTQKIFSFGRYSLVLTWWKNPKENEYLSLDYELGSANFSLLGYYGAFEKVAPKFLNPKNQAKLGAKKVLELEMQHIEELVKTENFVRNMFLEENPKRLPINRETFLHIKYED
jgi:hypothetical protein